MSNDNNDLGSFVAGFFIGSLVGAAVALLFAPQSGEETRTLIRDKSIELKDAASESAGKYYEQARMQAGDYYASSKQYATDISRRVSGTPVVEETLIEEVEEPSEEPAA